MIDHSPRTDSPAASLPIGASSPLLVLGLGNILLSDEGAGVHVVNQLAREHADRSDIEFMDGGTLSFSLAGAIAATDSLIVVDTAALDSAPGTVRVFEGDAMDQFVTTGAKTSVHEVSLSDLLAVTLLEGLLPRRRALVGIQPAYLDWGDRPTAPVADAIPKACEAVMDIVRRWQS